MTSPLPEAERRRWQPLRCGLVDLFYYDYQEFWFRDGRMLLRGNNGTGKSKVLALTLPFLLDGELTASRVEPDGDRGKKMEWNLLLGGRYDERLGYTWLEFGRRTEEGRREYFTIGCGMKAVTGRGIADRWFFTTSQRIGRDLFLIGPNDTTLPFERLAEEIGTHGQVTRKAEQYRRTIDERLFHLGADRYQALISLLLQLRQPQLSKKPDEEKLSQALSQALPPVDQAVISDVAAAFHELEQQREELAGLRDARTHLSHFLKPYRRYAAAAARRQAGKVRRAASEHEEVGRGLAATRTEAEQARRREEELQTQVEAAKRELEEQKAVRDELTGDPRLRDLNEAEQRAEQAEQAAERARRHAETAARQYGKLQRRHQTATRAAAQTRVEVQEAGELLTDAARSAGLEADDAQVRAALALPDGPPEEEIEPLLRRARRAAQTAAERRAQAVAHVTVLAEQAEKQYERLVAARSTLGEREHEHDIAADEVAQAHAAVSEAASALVAAWRSYAARVTELTVPHPEDVDLAWWAETLEGDNPAEGALRQAAAAAERELARQRAEAGAALQASREELERLTAEQDVLRRGEVQRPPVPLTRGEGVRDDRPGAPLWRVVDFHDDLAEAERAGLEAALQASGLLDAWITPEGRLLDPATHDTVLVAGKPVETGDLTGVLRPAIDPDDPQAAALSSDVVEAVLRSIGLAGPTHPDVWVAADGRWRLGPLHGAWSKPAAEFIGYAAREEARRRRLAELDLLIDREKQRITAATTAIEAVKQRQARLTAELQDRPSDQELRNAHSAWREARRALRRAAEKVEKQRQVVRAAEHAAAQAAQSRDEAAADVRVPTSLEELRKLAEAVKAYTPAVERLLGALWVHVKQVAELANWAEDLEEARQAHTTALEEVARAEREAAEAVLRRDTLRSSLQVTVEELNRRLTQTRTRIKELESHIPRAEEALREAAKQQAQAEARKALLEENLKKEAERRDEAVTEFQRFARTGLLEVALSDLKLPEQPWAPTTALRIARQTEQALQRDVPIDDESWRSLQDRTATGLQNLSAALTRHGHRVQAEHGDWLVVTVHFSGRDRSPVELLNLLEGAIAYQERILTARERELLEEHLVNEVASHLQELIGDAEAQVERMNAELEERPTSTGMRLRLRWEPRRDGPTGLAEARRRLLRQSGDLWSEEDRTAVSEFLQAQIEAVRSRNEQGTWHDHLREALDYRSWHRFFIDRRSDDRWRPASGPASGGERVLAVSLPLFAAASAHYRSAHPDAPRLVMLDEAFAGVDDDARRKCLGLLAAFDLDVVMTSEREWGFYSTVPGIATHHLVRRDGIDAVHVTTWEWDGSSRTMVERDYAARPPASVPSDEQALF